MQKILTFGFLSVLFVFPLITSAASVSIETIPTVCASAVFRGAADYSAPDMLAVKLNGSTIYTSTSGDNRWQVTHSGAFKGENALIVEISSSTAGVIASASQSFGANCGSTDPMAVTQPWGLTGHQTPVVPVGSTVTDKYGFRALCPIWFPKAGCFDVSNTEWYLAGVRKAFGLK